MTLGKYRVAYFVLNKEANRTTVGRVWDVAPPLVDPDLHTKRSQ